MDDTLPLNRKQRETVQGALDALGLALCDTGHRWTADERRLYDEAVKIVAAPATRQG